MNPLARKWSKDEVVVLLAAAVPGVREFLRGLYIREQASPDELGLPATVVQQASRLFHDRRKLPLFDHASDRGVRPARYTIRPEFRQALGEALRHLPQPATAPLIAVRARQAARSRSRAPISTFSFHFENPSEAAELVGLVSFLNEKVPMGLSFMLSGNGRDFDVEVR